MLNNMYDNSAGGLLMNRPNGRPAGVQNYFNQMRRPMPTMPQGAGLFQALAGGGMSPQPQRWPPVQMGVQPVGQPTMGGSMAADQARVAAMQEQAARNRMAAQPMGAPMQGGFRPPMRPTVPTTVGGGQPLRLPQSRTMLPPNQRPIFAAAGYEGTVSGALQPFVAHQGEQVSIKPAKPKKQFYSPELEGLKSNYLNQDWFQTPEYADKLQGYQDTLATPLQTQVGLSDQERQAILNQTRGNIMGTTQAQMQQMSNLMGGRGFAPGESGVGDTALGQVAQQGVEQFGQAASNLAIDEAKNRFSQRLGLDQLNTERMLGAGKFADILNQIQTGRMGMGLEGGKLGFEMEKYQKQKAAQAAAQSASGNRWSQEFEYRQQMDALKMLMGMGSQSQQFNQDAYGNYLGGYSQF